MNVDLRESYPSIATAVFQPSVPSLLPATSVPPSLVAIFSNSPSAASLHTGKREGQQVTPNDRALFVMLLFRD